MREHGPEMAWHKAYDQLKTGPSLVDLLKDYQNCSLEFRTAIGYGISDYMYILNGQIVENYEVVPSIVITVHEMLLDMLSKRNALLKNQYGENRVNHEHIV